MLLEGCFFVKIYYGGQKRDKIEMSQTRFEEPAPQGFAVQSDLHRANEAPVRRGGAEMGIAGLI